MAMRPDLARLLSTALTAVSLSCTAGCHVAEGQGGLPSVPAERFEDEVLKAPGVVVVDFWADWCVPCRQIRPYLEALAKEYEGRLKVCSVNFDRAPQWAETYHIEALPTVLLFKNGELQDFRIGVRSKAEYAAWFEEHL